MRKKDTEVYSFAGVEVVPADMDKVRQVVELYEQGDPPPVPPKVMIQTFESVMSERGFDEVDDTSDEGYKAAVEAHKKKIFRVMELYFFRNCVKDGAALGEMLADDVKRVGLFKYIISISEITEESIAAAMERFRVYVARQTAVGLQHRLRARQDAPERAGIFCGSENVSYDYMGLRRTVNC